MAFYCLIQSRHEIVHDRWRSERFEAVLDLRVSRMPAPVAGSDIDDLHVIQRRLKDVRSKSSAFFSEFRQIRFGRHVFRLDEDRQVRHGPTPGSAALCRRDSSIARSSGHRDARPWEAHSNQD